MSATVGMCFQCAFGCSICSNPATHPAADGRLPRLAPVDSLPPTWDPDDVPLSASPVRNGCWADEVEWQERRFAATAALQTTATTLPVPTTPVPCPSPGASSTQSLSCTPPPTCHRGARPEHCLCGECCVALTGVGPSEEIPRPLWWGFSSSGGCSEESHEPEGASEGTPLCDSLSRHSSTASSQPTPSDALCGSVAVPPAEAALVEIVVGLLQSPEVNPHQGSLSLDKLRFFARRQAPELYEAVVGVVDTISFWKELVSRHRETLQIVAGNARLKKICLADNRQWKENDKKLRAGIKAQEAHIVACLKGMLRRNPKLTLPEFLQAYPAIPGADPEVHVPLPQGADLARLLQRHRLGLNGKYQFVALHSKP